jgi:hypothetical protein
MEQRDLIDALVGIRYALCPEGSSGNDVMHHVAAIIRALPADVFKVADALSRLTLPEGWEAEADSDGLGIVLIAPDQRIVAVVTYDWFDDGLEQRRVWLRDGFEMRFSTAQQAVDAITGRDAITGADR